MNSSQEQICFTTRPMAKQHSVAKASIVKPPAELCEQKKTHTVNQNPRKRELSQTITDTMSRKKIKLTDTTKAGKHILIKNKLAEILKTNYKMPCISKELFKSAEDIFSGVTYDSDEDSLEDNAIFEVDEEDVEILQKKMKSKKSLKQKKSSSQKKEEAKPVSFCTRLKRSATMYPVIANVRTVMVSGKGDFTRTPSITESYKMYQSESKNCWEQWHERIIHECFDIPKIKSEDGKFKIERQPEKDDWAIVDNIFPYHWPDGYRHYVIWFMKDRPLQWLCDRALERFPDHGLVIWVNPLKWKSVAAILHAQILVKMEGRVEKKGIRLCVDERGVQFTPQVRRLYNLKAKM